MDQQFSGNPSPGLQSTKVSGGRLTNVLHAQPRLAGVPYINPMTYCEVLREATHVEDGGVRVQVEKVVLEVWLQFNGWENAGMLASVALGVDHLQVLVNPT